VARRAALAAAFFLIISLAGDLSVHAQPVSAPPQPRVETVATPEPHVAPRRSPSKPAARPGTLVAHLRAGRTVVVRSAPAGRVLVRLASRTEFGSPRTLAVTAAGRGLRVITTELPNGRTGWVDAPRALRLTRARVTLDVDLSTRMLRVRVGAHLLRAIPVGIGAPGTPTPTGRFAITDKLRGADYSAVYGCCILALSGHQTNLPRGWTGGDRLAIHGGSTRALSTGCLHAAEADLRYLMRVVPLGAQITIHP
jgi:lipoprotein-anchoring transpeptidase ErfK/SrfK